MKRTRLKRKSPNQFKILTDKADRALQDWYRANYDEMCEGCGKNKFQLMHHFIEKHSSAFLRFNKLNLIFLCISCHFKHHRLADSRIHANIILKRGNRWLKSLMTKSIKPFQLTDLYLKKQLKKYS
jgi:hypothetical protein